MAARRLRLHSKTGTAFKLCRFCACLPLERKRRENICVFAAFRRFCGTIDRFILPLAHGC